MEVQVIHAENVPEGSLLSIRAGTTRRQAGADPQQRFRFPKGQEAVSDPLKIDVLSPLGGSRLVLKGGEERYTVPIKSADGSRTMNITLEVKGAVVNGMKLPSAIPSPIKESQEKGEGGRRHLAALQAREYLDEHSVLQVVQSLLQDICKKRPKDPWQYMQQHLPDGVKQAAIAPEETKAPPAQLVPAAEVQAAAKVPDSQVPPAQPAPASGPYDEVAEVAPEPVKAPEPGVPPIPEQGPVTKASVVFVIKNVGFALLDDESKELLKSGITKTFAESAGVAENAVTVNLSPGSVKVEVLLNVPVEQSMGSLKETLMQANLDRKVLELAASIDGVNKAAYGDIEVGKPLVVAAEGVDIDAVRERMKESFEQGVSDGTLQNLLATGKPSQEGNKALDPVDLELVRVKARKNLEQGIMTGILEQIVAETSGQSEEIESIRLKAKNTLEKGCQNGELNKCLTDGASTAPATDIEALRLKACLSLEKSAFNGQLCKYLEQEDDVKPISQDIPHGPAYAALETKVAEAEAPACAAPEEPVPVKKEVPKRSASQKGGKMLLAGLRDGSLEKIVDDMEAKAEAAEKACTVEPSAGSSVADVPKNDQVPEEKPKEVSVADEIDLDALRSKVRTTFETGLGNGELSTALAMEDDKVEASGKAGVDIDVLRQRTSQRLSEGLESGKLETLLGEPAPEPASQGDSKVNLDALRLKAQGALDMAASNGNLGVYLDEELGQKSAPSTDKKEDCTPVPEAAVAGPDMTALRMKAQKSLEIGADSGQLQRSLAGTTEVIPTPAPAVEPVKPAIDLAQTRLKAQQSLDRGIQDGSLEKIMQSTQSPPKTAEDESAEDLLLKAQEDLATAMSGEPVQDSARTKEADRCWVAEQEEIKVLMEEVDTIKDMNQKAQGENTKLRLENEALQAQLARLLELEELDAQS